MFPFGPAIFEIRTNTQARVGLFFRKCLGTDEIFIYVVTYLCKTKLLFPLSALISRFLRYCNDILGNRIFAQTSPV